MNERSSPRVPAGSGVWIQCRRPTAGSADLANGLLDLSAGGVQFLAKALLQAGDALEVVLNGSRLTTPIRRQGEVRWVVPLGTDACCVGVRFLEALAAAELQSLGEPVEPNGEL